MIVSERVQAVKEYKRARGCSVCGLVRADRDLLLVRRDGTGASFSRLLARASVSDEALWEEILRRVVVCRKCLRRGKPYGHTRTPKKRERR